MMNPNNVVYTAIIGDYDKPRDPIQKSIGWDYILFTDNRSIKSDIWDVRYLNKPDNINNVKFARFIKIMCGYYLPDYSLSIWIDANIEINCNIDVFVKKYLPYGFNMAIMSHPNRNCIYQEANACINLNKDNFKTVQRQINHYKQKGYPKNNGMVATGIMIRNHSNIMMEFMQTWWKEVQIRSHRDQLSFNYVHHMNFSFILMEIFPWDIVFNGPFVKYKHPKNKLC